MGARVMPRFTKMPKGDGSVPTFLCRNRLEVTAALAAIRKHLGISQLELDEIAGFHTGYTGKLEKPFTPGKPGKRGSGRSALHPMIDLWFGALEVEVLIVPKGTEIPGAIEAADITSPMNTKRADKIRALHAAGMGKHKIAKQFGIPYGMVRDILADRAYVAGQQRQKAA